MFYLSVTSYHTVNIYVYVCLIKAQLKSKKIKLLCWEFFLYQLHLSMNVSMCCFVNTVPILYIHVYFGFCYVVFNSQVFNATEVQLWKWCFHIKFILFMRPVHVWRSRTPDSVRCAHFPSVITTIIDQKVQFLNPLN
jgi:hypothetical protein